MLTNYILDAAGNPVPEPDVLAWVQWFGDSQNRRVAETYIEDIHVSTVFLGIDHNWEGVGPPVLWETMVFVPQDDSENAPLDACVRYTSREKALKGHQLVVQKVVQAVHPGYQPPDEEEPPSPPTTA